MATSGDSGGDWRAALDSLIAKHPRSTWPRARSATAAFWLEVHEHLRRDAAGLEAAADDRRRGRCSPAQLAIIAAPRFRGLVAGMHGHHQIEDFLYFPALRLKEPTLAAGFDRLESEHAELVRAVAEAEAALSSLAAAAGAAADASHTSTLAAERTVRAIDRLCADLLAHLTREEDLVVPLLIERGDP